MNLFKLISTMLFVCFISINVSAFSLEMTHQFHLGHLNTSLDVGQELVIAPSSILLISSTSKSIIIFLCGGMFGGIIGLLAGGIIAGGGSKTMCNPDKEGMLTLQ